MCRITTFVNEAPERISYFPEARKRYHIADYSDDGARCGMISKLPDECLCQIFSKLYVPRDKSACASVCWKWLTLISHMSLDEYKQFDRETSSESTEPDETSEVSQSLQGDLTRSLEGKRATDVRLAAIAIGIAGRGGLGNLQVKGCGINGPIRVTNFGISAIGICCAGLRSFTLWECPYVDSEGLVSIARGCKLLEKVDILNCPRVGDRGIIALAESCKKLNFLSLEGCSQVGDSSFEKIGQYCTELSTLNVSDCHLIGAKGLVAIANGCRSLSKMKLGGKTSLFDDGFKCLGDSLNGVSRLRLTKLEHLTEVGLRALGETQGFKALTSLQVLSCPGMSDSVLESIGNGCTELKFCNLYGCGSVTDNGLKAFMKGTKSIDSLQIGSCPSISHTGVRSILSQADKLRVLAINDCLGISDRGFSSQSLMISTSSLKSVKVTNSVGVGNAFLALIGRSCPLLEHVDFSGLTKVGDRGVCALTEGCGKSLTTINLTGCFKVSDAGVSSIAKHCGDTLTNLTLYGCWKVTDRGVLSLSTHCTSLQDLDVSQCSISNDSVKAIIDSRGKELRSLSLSKCHGINDDCLKYIKPVFGTLWGLNLKNCQGLSTPALQSLESQVWKSGSSMCLFIDI